MRILTTLVFILCFMSSTGVFAHIHCDLSEGVDKHHEVKAEKHCADHAQKTQGKKHSPKSHSSCLVLCCVSTLSHSDTDDLLIANITFLKQLSFASPEENPRSYNYRLFRPPIILVK